MQVFTRMSEYNVEVVLKAIKVINQKKRDSPTLIAAISFSNAVSTRCSSSMDVHQKPQFESSVETIFASRLESIYSSIIKIIVEKFSHRIFYRPSPMQNFKLLFDLGSNTKIKVHQDWLRKIAFFSTNFCACSNSIWWPPDLCRYILKLVTPDLLNKSLRYFLMLFFLRDLIPLYRRSNLAKLKIFGIF